MIFFFSSPSSFVYVCSCLIWSWRCAFSEGGILVNVGGTYIAERSIFIFEACALFQSGTVRLAYWDILPHKPPFPLQKRNLIQIYICGVACDLTIGMAGRYK